MSSRTHQAITFLGVNEPKSVKSTKNQFNGTPKSEIIVQTKMTQKGQNPSSDLAIEIEEIKRAVVQQHHMGLKGIVTKSKFL